MAKNGAPGAKAKVGDNSVKKKLNCSECGTETVGSLEEMLRHKQWCPAVRAKNDADAKAKAAASNKKRKNR
jgi:hypothetical protein